MNLSERQNPHNCQIKGKTPFYSNIEQRKRRLDYPKNGLSKRFSYWS